jgi:hypothetical protein
VSGTVPIRVRKIREFSATRHASRAALRLPCEGDVEVSMTCRRFRVLCSLALTALAFPSTAQLTATKWTEMGRGILAGTNDVVTRKEIPHHQSGRAWQLAITKDPDPAQTGLDLWVLTSHGGLWRSVLDAGGSIASFIPVTDNFPGPISLGSFVIRYGEPNKILIGPGSP